VTSRQHVYEVRPPKDHRGVDLISDALLSGRLWVRRTQNDTVIRVYDKAGNEIETHV
jgi:ribosomal protein S11